MSRRFLFCFLIAYLCSGIFACRSTVGGGQARAELVNKDLDGSLNDLDQLKDAVAKSNATPEQKRSMNDTIENVKTTVRSVKPSVTQLGKDTDHNQEIAISHEAKSRAMTLVIVVLVSLAVIGLLVWRVLATRKTPVS